MSFIKRISTFTIANILNKGIAFFLLPFLTQKLTTTQQGTLSLFQISLLYIVPLITILINSMISIEYYRKDFGSENFPKFIFNGFFLNFILVLFWSILFFVFNNEINQLTGIEKRYIYIMPLLAFVTGIIEAFKSLLISQKKAKEYSVFLIIFSFADFGTSLYLLMISNLSIDGRILGIISSKIVFGVIAFYLIYKNIGLEFKISKVHLKAILQYCIPLLPHTLGALIMHSSDQFFIRNIVSPEELGIYSVAYIIGSSIILIDTSFNQTFAPTIFENLKKQGNENLTKLVKISLVYFSILTVIVFVLILSAGFIYEYFIDAKFIAGKTLIPYIALGYFFLAIYKLFTNYLFYYKKTFLLSKITFSCSFITILLNYLFITEWGIMGAALSTMVSFAIFMTVTIFYANKTVQLPWSSTLKVYRNN